MICHGWQKKQQDPYYELQGWKFSLVGGQRKLTEFLWIVHSFSMGNPVEFQALPEVS
jgi:hypothetical protein